MSNITSAPQRNNPAADRLKIIAGLGGDEATGMCCCPAHDDKNPSLHVSANGKRLLWRCHAGCSQEQVGLALRERGLLSGRSQPSSALRSTINQEPGQDQAGEIRRLTRKRSEMMDEQRAILENYLSSRGIERLPARAKFLSATDSAKATGKRFPALAFNVIGREGKVLSLHVTWLAKDGSSKLNVDDPKRMYGSVSGGFVQFGKLDPEKPLIIAEGIENALSASQITGMQAIAALSAANLKKVDVPDASEYFIAADNDESGVGQRSAEELALRISLTGKRVRIVVPDGVGNDWNDALQNGKPRTLKTQFLKAPQFKPEESERTWQLLTLDDVEPRKIDWLWWRWFPRGMLTIVAGDGEVGKTTMIYDIAARVTKGEFLPAFDGEPRVRAPLGSVLIFSKEDDCARIVAPRLHAAGADMKRVHMPIVRRSDEKGDFDIVAALDQNIEMLERLIRDQVPDTRLICIEPISDFAGRKNIYRDDEIRQLLNPLGRLAAKYNIAVVMTAHLNKNTEKSARHRVMGSAGMVNVVRQQVIVLKDRDQPEVRYLAPGKGNLLAESEKKAVSFSMRTSHSQPVIEWDTAFHTVKPDEALAEKGPTKQQQAKDMLETYLADGPKRQQDIISLAKEQGIHEGTVNLVKKALKIPSTKGKGGHWFWSLP